MSPGPASVAELFLAFNRLALQGFGGVLPVAQRELVERLGWLGADEFTELLGLCQVLPGPNVVNLSLMLGDRYFGLRGALAALAGMLGMPLVIVLTMASLTAALPENARMAGALRGMGAVSAGLMLATAIKLLPSLRSNPMGRPAAAVLASLSFLAVVWLQLPLVWLVAGLGGAGLLLAWRRLRRPAR